MGDDEWNIDLWDVPGDSFTAGVTAGEAPSSNSERSRQLRIERQKRYRLNLKNKKQERESELGKTRSNLDKLQSENKDLTLIQHMQHKALEYLDIMTSAATSFIGRKKETKKERSPVFEPAAIAPRAPAAPAERKWPGRPTDLVLQLFGEREPSEEFLR